MELWLTGYDGGQILLPTVTRWEFSYGLGSPCDSFEVTCLWETGAETLLADAVTFHAVHEGETVFTGRVDEYACIRDEEGGRLELSGRGMQALLLDNQALPMEDQLATAADILRDHVTPYGIGLEGSHTLGAVAGFAVSSGQSEWSVVHDFACYHGGIVPRFDRQGRLILSGWDATERVVDDRTAVTGLRYQRRRYGVLSEVVVRDRNRKVTETVRDAEFLARGGRCRRVITTAGRSYTAAMRYSGEYQLRAARAEETQCVVTTPKLFFAWPGEQMRVERTGFGGNGTYRVAESVTGVDDSGSYTKVTLGPPDLLI